MPLTKLESSEATAVSSGATHPSVDRAMPRTEHHGQGLLDRFAEPAHWAVYQAPVQLFGRVEEVHEEWGFERAAGVSAAFVE